MSSSTALPSRTPGGSRRGSPSDLDLPRTATVRERPTVRVVAVYGTSWTVPEDAGLTPATDQLQIAGRPVADRTPRLPTVLAETGHEPSSLRTPRGKGGERSLGVTTWMFALPSAHLVAALALDVVGTAADLRPLLVDLIEGEAEIDGRALVDLFTMKAGGSGELTPERHVIASFTAAADAQPSAADVPALLYPASRADNSSDLVVHRPADTTGDGATWVSPYVTVARGHEPGMDRAMVLSVALAVGAAASLREIRSAVYETIGDYRMAGRELRSTHASRRFLEGVASRIGDLEAELAFSVEAATDAGAVLPHRPVEAYHRTVVRALDVSGRALAVGRLLGRLAQGVAAELVAVASAEWRIESVRRTVWSGLVWVLLLVGVPAAIAVGYAARSGGYTDDQDITAYVIAGVAALVLVIAYAVVASTVRRRTRRRRE